MLIGTYLALSKILTPKEFGMLYIPNQKSLEQLTKANPASAILIDMHATGFIIKTYYQKYRLIEGINNIEEVIVRTSQDFAIKNKQNIGMSIFRRNEDKTSLLALPPGTELVGNLSYGHWNLSKKNYLEWIFHRAYKNFPTYLGWGSFRPDQRFFEQAVIHIEHNKPFYGVDGEFGLEGRVTKKNFPHFFRQDRVRKTKFKEFFIDYIKKNF